MDHAGPGYPPVLREVLVPRGRLTKTRTSFAPCAQAAAADWPAPARRSVPGVLGTPASDWLTGVPGRRERSPVGIPVSHAFCDLGEAPLWEAGGCKVRRGRGRRTPRKGERVACLAVQMPSSLRCHPSRGDGGGAALGRQLACLCRARVARGLPGKKTGPSPCLALVPVPQPASPLCRCCRVALFQQLDWADGEGFGVTTKLLMKVRESSVV